jgi:predicted dehydrogenase
MKTAATAAAGVAALHAVSPRAYAQGSDKIRVGLIGCGGRGTGAARDCVAAGPNVQITALGDLFADRMQGARERLGRLPSEKYAATDETCFVGFDAYQKVIDSDVDLVLLAAPPGFRPMHLKAAVEAGKHVFAEKPVATDSVGIRTVLAAADLAKQKNLAIVAGTQRRHCDNYRQIVQRIHDGAIGRITTAQCYWNQGGLWMKPRQPEWTDMEWQVRNWLYFTWLAGDIILEQHIHQLDVINWVMGSPPINAYGIGGREVRKDAAYGNIYDHFTVEFEYPNGIRVMSMCRQIDGTDSRILEHVQGTDGEARVDSIITGRNEYRFQGKPPSGYPEEHVHLIESIRSGNPINEGRQVAESNLTCIMGRMSAYTGKVVTWEQAMNSQLDLTPKEFAFGPLATPPVAVPGKDPLL